VSWQPKEPGITATLKDFYQKTPTSRYAYANLKVEYIPKAIINVHILYKLVHEGYVFIKEQNDMYGPPPIGILANSPPQVYGGTLLIQCVSLSCVCVGGGGLCIKYTDGRDVHHLCAALRK